MAPTVDITAQLPHSDTLTRWRVGNPRFITVHVNGPDIPQQRTLPAWIDHLKDIARFHMGPYLTESGIAYHDAFLPDGTHLHMRDDQITLWHCANATGNEYSLSAHFPKGYNQPVTPAAWASFTAWADAKIAEYGMAGRGAVWGHRHWPRKSAALPSVAIDWQKGQGECPGSPILALLHPWRGETLAKTYRVKQGIDFAAVREGRGNKFKIAWNGTCKLQPGQVITVDDVTDGWAHWPGGGFVLMTLLEQV